MEDMTILNDMFLYVAGRLSWHSSSIGMISRQEEPSLRGVKTIIKYEGQLLVGSQPAAVNSHQNTILYTNIKEKNRISKTKIWELTTL
jgi:hypothetical protein